VRGHDHHDSCSSAICRGNNVRFSNRSSVWASRTAKFNMKWGHNIVQPGHCSQTTSKDAAPSLTDHRDCRACTVPNHRYPAWPYPECWRLSRQRGGGPHCTEWIRRARPASSDVAPHKRTSRVPGTPGSIRTETDESKMSESWRARVPSSHQRLITSMRQRLCSCNQYNTTYLQAVRIWISRICAVRWHYARCRPSRGMPKQKRE